MVMSSLVLLKQVPGWIEQTPASEKKKKGRNPKKKKKKFKVENNTILNPTR